VSSAGKKPPTGKGHIDLLPLQRLLLFPLPDLEENLFDLGFQILFELIRLLADLPALCLGKLSQTLQELCQAPLSSQEPDPEVGNLFL